MADIVNKEKCDNGIATSKRYIQSAAAKTANIRAAASLMHGTGSSPSLRFPATSPHKPNAQDYPVFTPSYDDDVLQQIPPKSWNYSDGWGDDYGTPNASSRKCDFKFNSHVCPSEDQIRSILSSGTSHLYNKSRNSAESLSSCNKCNPIEMLKRQVIEANQQRDSALSQVIEMKSSLGDLTQKLDYLETYCEQLKMALGKAVALQQAKSIDGGEIMPVSEQVMEEGFLQIVSEARVSVKQLCKILLRQIDEQDFNIIDKLNAMLEPHRLDILGSRTSRKAVVYHLESIINQVLYQDFENCIYQNSGASKILNPVKRRQDQFESFVSLRDLSWKEVSG